MSALLNTTPVMPALAPASMAGLQELEAVLAGAPQLALQPIHGAGHPWGEVLLRPPRTTAESLVSVAAAAGRAPELDLHIARHALAAMESGCWYSLNVSPLSLAEPDFARRLLDVFWAQDRDRTTIVLEVLEEPQLSDRQRPIASQSIKILRALGVRIALDDVGRVPLQFPIPLFDVLKLDRCMVAALREPGSRGRALDVTHWVRFGLLVVAEGIESQSDLECIQDCGVFAWQGHHGGLPQPWGARS